MDQSAKKNLAFSREVGRRYQAVVLAAGESSRFWPLNKKHKFLTKMMGKPLLYWTLKGLSERGIREAIIVSSSSAGIKKEIENEKDFDLNLTYVFQEKPLGTGNALLQAKPFIKKPFIVLHPYKFYINEIVADLLKEKAKAKKEVILVGVPTSMPWDYGVLCFSKSEVKEICENPRPGKEPSNIRTLGIYLLTPDFFDYYQKIEQDREDSLIVALNLILKKRGGGAVVLKEGISSLKYPWDTLSFLGRLLNSSRLKSHCSKSALMGKNVVINGKVFIGNNAVIADNTVINGPCFIGDNCKIGASNVLRGPVDLEEGVITGAFCEIKNCLVGRETHLHRGFIGDSVIGENCRFGAGFISANRRFDRQNIFTIVKGEKIDSQTTYFGFAAGENTSFGIGASTLPGVLIGSDCIIGPNTMVEENIADNTTFYSVFEKVIKKRTG